MTCILNLFLSKQLTINKCTLLDSQDCTNTEILMYCICLQYTPTVRCSLHTLVWYRHTYMTFPPPDRISFLTPHRNKKRFKVAKLMLYCL